MGFLKKAFGKKNKEEEYYEEIPPQYEEDGEQYDEYDTGYGSYDEGEAASSAEPRGQGEQGDLHARLFPACAGGRGGGTRYEDGHLQTLLL